MSDLTGVQTEFVGGIPTAIFRPSFRDQFTAASGRELQAIVSARGVYISDPGDENLHFSAFVDPAEDEDVLNMGADIRSVRRDGTHHPDIYAGLLLGRSLQHFDEFNSKPVSIFEAKWGEESVNYQIFRSRQALLGQHASMAHLCEIADRHTWTGQIVNRLGFYATSVVDQRFGIKVLYRRRPH